MHASLALALVCFAPNIAPKPVSKPIDATELGDLPAASLNAYLRVPKPVGARFLDHGTIALAGAGGTPHIYRLDLRVGLFDHLSVGVTAHWLPGERAPQVWPVGAVAFWRWQGRARVGVEIGAHYRPVLYPPPEPEHFMPMTHMVLSSVVISSGWFSAGLDLGAAHTRVALVDPVETMGFQKRVVFAGGPFVRVGNHFIGVGADAHAVLAPEPLLVFELAIEGRFDAFGVL